MTPNTELLKAMIAERVRLIDALEIEIDLTEKARLRVAIDSLYTAMYALIALTEDGRNQLDNLS